MILSKLIKRLRLKRPVNTCLLCSKPEEIISESENVSQIKPEEEKATEIIKEKKRRPPSKTHLADLEQFFLEYPHLQDYKDFIPSDLLFYKSVGRPKSMYLICSKVAKQVANHILPIVNINKDQVIAETNPGLGLISHEMIKKGVPLIRLYEKNKEFQEILELIYKRKQDHFQLHNKDFFKFPGYSYVDRLDQGNRVSSLLEGVPRKSWTDEPVMTIVGTMTDLTFTHFLIKSIVMQKDIATYGRIEIFALIFPKDWFVLNSTKEDQIYMYRPWTLLFCTFFEVKFLEKFPRKLFLPWSSVKKTTQSDEMYFEECNYIYLTQISMKKDFWLNAEEFVPFYCFVKHFIRSGNNPIIPICEKWVPDCGLSLIAPRLKHKDYFDDMSIFTKFNELTPKQIFGVFKEMSSLPQYFNSPFMDMVEQEMIKSETISSDLYASHKYRRKEDEPIKL